MELNQVCDEQAKLANCAHGPVLQISKSKTVNFNLQGALGQTGHVKKNIINGFIPIKVQNLPVNNKLSKVLKFCLLGPCYAT
jgi:hypothetical protein